MKIDAATMDTLRALKLEGNRVVIAAKLDRGAYVRVNDVLNALGGKWTRKVQAHVFADDPRELIDGVLDTGLVETDADMGFFPTPPAVAEALLAFMDPVVSRPKTWLEPSAGDGQLAMQIKVHSPLACMCLIEMHHGRAKELMKLFPQETVMQRDFLGLDVAQHGVYDYIAMNPPFDKKGTHIAHVRHAYEFFGGVGRGVLGAILPQGVLFRDDRKHADFRAWVESHGGTWSNLPELSFRTSGTDVRTCMLRMEA